MSEESTTEGSPSGDAFELDEERDALLSQLRVIEDQPLEERAAAYLQVHDRLQARLEGGDAAARRS